MCYSFYLHKSRRRNLSGTVEKQKHEECSSRSRRTLRHKNIRETKVGFTFFIRIHIYFLLLVVLEWILPDSDRSLLLVLFGRCLRSWDITPTPPSECHSTVVVKYNGLWERFSQSILLRDYTWIIK